MSPLYTKDEELEMKFKTTLLPVIILLTTLLLLLPAGAIAAKESAVWVTLPGPQASGSGDEGQSAGESFVTINLWPSTIERTYYLFLPAYADASRLTIGYSDAKALVIDGRTITTGDAADYLTPGAKLPMTLNSAKYTLKVMQSANIPAMFLHTESGSVAFIHKTKKNQEPGSLVMADAHGAALYNGALSQIKGRGNYTFSLRKKPYQIKLEKSADLCGMGKAKTWILLANHYDNSLLRNKIAFDLADAIGLEYSSKSQAVDVYVNSDYCGSYLLCEKVEIGDARIDINNLEKDTEKVNSDPLETYPQYGKKSQSGKSKGAKIPNDPTDITGGYLLELDYMTRYTNEISGFITTRGQPVTIKEPEFASQAQAEYIRTFMQGFENAIFAADGKDPKTGKHYSEFVDMDSLVKKYLMEEFVKNFDGNRSSLFYYKPADEQSKLAFAGPVWDYDIAFGNYAKPRNQRAKNPKYFITNADSGERYYWLPAVYKQPDFKAAAIKTYHEIYVPALHILLGNAPSGSGSLRSLDEYVQELEASAAMNFARWPIFNSPNWQVETGKDYPTNIAYLKSFIEGRMAFLNENWPQE